MKIPPKMPRLKGFGFTREIIVYAVGAYHRFAFSRADVADLLAERGGRSAGKQSGNGSGHFAHCIRRDRPAAADKWHMDEVVIPDQRSEMLALAGRGCERRCS